MKFALLGCLLIASGCAHSLHEVHTSDFAPYSALERGDVVTSKTEQFVILGITGNTDYVEDAYQKLMAECPHGVITGITTQYLTSLNFFSWKNKILMQGLCLSKQKS